MQLQQLNAELYTALTNMLFNVGALKYSMTEYFPEIRTKYTMLTQSRFFITDEGKQGAPIPMVTDLLKDVTAIEKRVSELHMRLRMRIAKKGYDSEVTENIDYAMHLAILELQNYSEDDLYKLIDELKTRRKNAGKN